MRRTATLTVALLAVSLVYCDDPTGILGELGFGIESGREQTVAAPETTLPDPVVARVVRDASGQVSLRVGAVPLFAQSSVTGVVGAVVCVGEVPIEGEPFIPHARCTATEDDGRATFHLAHPKAAGRHRSPIVAEYEGEALTPDTVTADVLPGPPTEHPFTSGYESMGTSDHVFPELVTDEFGNEHPWMPASDCACVKFTGSLEADAVRTIAPVEVGEGTFHILITDDTLATGTVTVESIPDDPTRLRWILTVP